jgi:hypothetical protein
MSDTGSAQGASSFGFNCITLRYKFIVLFVLCLGRIHVLGNTLPISGKFIQVFPSVHVGHYSTWHYAAGATCDVGTVEFVLLDL